MQSKSNENNAPPKAGQLKNVLPAQPSVTDEKILAEFERLVLAGHSRENAKRLTRDLFGRAALGTGGRTRAAISAIVRASKVTKPKEAKAETETKAEAEEAQGEPETNDVDKDCMIEDAFRAAGCYEPTEEQRAKLRAILDLRFARTGSVEIAYAEEIAEAIFLGKAHPDSILMTKVDTEPLGSPLPVPTLVELEAKVSEALDWFKRSGWEWACALTAIHDSKLFPDSASAGSWERYTELRWGLGRSQSYRIVAWVHREIEMVVPSLESPAGDSPAPVASSLEVESPAGDLEKPPVASGLLGPGNVEAPERKAPPATPIFKSERASRTASAKSKPRPRKVPGKLTESDLNDLRDDGKVVSVEGTEEEYARTEADRLVAEGTLAKVDGKYYDPSTRTGATWFLFHIEDNNDGLVETFERFIEARSSHPNFADLLTRFAVLANRTPAS